MRPQATGSLDVPPRASRAASNKSEAEQAGGAAERCARSQMGILCVESGLYAKTTTTALRRGKHEARTCLWTCNGRRRGCNERSNPRIYDPSASDPRWRRAADGQTLHRPSLREHGPWLHPASDWPRQGRRINRPAAGLCLRAMQNGTHGRDRLLKHCLGSSTVCFWRPFTWERRLDAASAAA